MVVCALMVCARSGGVGVGLGRRWGAWRFRGWVFVVVSAVVLSSLSRVGFVIV